MNRVITVVLCSFFVSAAAQELPCTTVSYQLGFGRSQLLDTYLSQEKFAGPAFTFLATREHTKPDRRWSTLVEHELNYANADDRSDKCTELQGDYSLFVAKLRGWQLASRLKVQAGAAACANIGFIYNTSNSNNPAQGRLSLQFMPTATATYGFPLFKRTCRLRYELQLPLAGVLFSPNYGQSYYEIFSLGDYDHNVVATTPFSAPNFRQQLSVEYTIPRFATLRIGYLGHYQQAKVNNLKSHIYSHRLMVGIVMRFAKQKLPNISQ